MLSFLKNETFFHNRLSNLNYKLFHTVKIFDCSKLMQDHYVKSILLDYSQTF